MIFRNSFFLCGEVLHGISLHLMIEHGDFWIIDISQGSVATWLRHGGIFKYDFIAKLLLSLTVKQFRKSVNIWRSNGQGYGVLFFDSQGISDRARFWHEDHYRRRLHYIKRAFLFRPRMWRTALGIRKIAVSYSHSFIRGCIFTARRYSSAVLAIALSVSVPVSFTSRISIEKAERIELIFSRELPSIYTTVYCKEIRVYPKQG